MLQELETERPTSRMNGSAVHRSVLSAHYESLWRQLQPNHAPAADSQAIGFMSCASRAGVSTVAINIAITAARSACGPVLFVDADLSKSRVGNLLERAPAMGL